MELEFLSPTARFRGYSDEPGYKLDLKIDFIWKGTVMGFKLHK